MTTTDLDLGKYKLGWSDEEDYVFKPKKGLNESIVREMSAMKKEPEWMRDFRLRALQRFEKREMAEWFAVNMPDLDFDDIYYYIKPTSGQVEDWNDLPDAIKNTYEKLGIPEAERKYLAGVTAQYESEVVFHRNREDLEALGVLFCDMDTAVREYPDLVRKYFGKIIPPNDNKFAALNSAVWSGGSFIYVPPNVIVDQPLQAYFRINAENMGQFERTLIIADVGCSGALHRGLLGPGVHQRLPPLRGGRAGGAGGFEDHLHHHPELVEQRLQPGDQAGQGRSRGPRGVDRRQHRLAADHEVPVGLPDGAEGLGRGALGGLRRSRPASGRRGQDVPLSLPRPPPPSCPSRSPRMRGITTYRGKVHVDEGAKRAKSFVRCDALLLDDTSVSETKPYMEVAERDARIGHEATVSKVGDDQLFYLMSRGLSETQAMGMIVNGFIEPITRTLPMEYAVEWSRLIELQMEGSVG